METRFDFSFVLDQEVITLFGDSGIIEMLGFDDGGRKYYVKTATTSNWFKESQLLEKMLQEERDLIADFVKAKCKDQSDDVSVPSIDLYAAFKCFCEENGYPEISLRYFSMRLATLGYSKIRAQGKLYWQGISLLETSST